MAMTNEERAKKMAERIAAQVKRSAGKGIAAATIFLAARWRETVNVPAKTKPVRGPTGAIIYRRATTPAIFGAPIRKVTGRAQGSITYKVSEDKLTGTVGMSARSDKGFNYPLHHEIRSEGRHSGEHPHLQPTVDKWKSMLAVIVGRTFILGMRAEGTS